MRKCGVFSFVVYLLYTLAGGGMVLYNYIAIQKHNAEGGGIEGLGLALLFVLGIICGAAGLVGVILKLIHMKSGWVLFGLLCIALDLVFVAAWISMTAPGGNMDQIVFNDILPVIPFILISLASAVTNAISLKK